MTKIHNTSVIKLNNIEKTYFLGEDMVRAVDNASLEIKKGEYVSILGSSGSGKSTLMHIIGLLDRPTSGKILINNQDISKLKDEELSQLRNTFVGFVFQQFNLINKLTVLENVALPALYYKGSLAHKEKLEFDPLKKATELLEQLGMGKRLNFYPNKISGGQQQRVAIARSLIMSPDLILADEPTGNLDTRTGDEILKLLSQLNKEEKITILIVTHEHDIAAKTRRKIQIVDGHLV